MTDEENMISLRAQDSLGYLSEIQKKNLVRLTAAHADNHVRWQVVVLDQATDEELDEYACIFTEVLADFLTATGEEEVIRVTARADSAAIDPLPIAISPPQKVN